MLQEGLEQYRMFHDVKPKLLEVISNFVLGKKYISGLHRYRESSEDLHTANAFIVTINSTERFHVIVNTLDFHCNNYSVPSFGYRLLVGTAEREMCRRTSRPLTRGRIESARRD
jgi:hypothetical protein